MHRSRLPYSYLYIPALALIGLFMWGPSFVAYGGLYVAQYTGSMYAFYLDGGQTLFGQVQSVGMGTVRLHDVYTFQNVTVGSTATSNLTSQRSNALTRPQNWLAVQWRHVVFFEEVGPDAKIREVIDAQP